MMTISSPPVGGSASIRTATWRFCVELNGEALGAWDGAAISDETDLGITALGDSQVLGFDLN